MTVALRLAGAIRTAIGERERHRGASADAELADRGEILAAQLDRRAQLDRIRAGNGTDAEVLAPDPRHDRAIAKAHDQLHAHLHPAAHASHRAHDVYAFLIVGERHEVGHNDRAILSLERGLEDGGAGQVAPLRALDFAVRRDQPAAVMAVAEQRCETGIGVEARQAQPVDRAVAPDQGS
jgi:hypothetical protein